MNAGHMLGPYRILEKVGAGGMGEVYKARDTRLDRTVAIKVLPAELSADPERRARFEREAKTVAGLSHPHICALFDVGEHDGSTFLVMEHLAGESLAERLQRGPIPLAHAIEIAAQIAEALDAAHKHGIIHRDLKPGNVMLTEGGSGRSGTVSAKLLDFGLAKLAAHGERPALASDASAPTKSLPVTARGGIVGTLQYMAPEQLEGKQADARTDLWALGALLYEMVTGKRAFEADSDASLIGAILNTEPAGLATLQPLTPPSLERLVSRCLAKHPDGRWDTAHDVADELRWISQSGVAGHTLRPVPGQANTRTWQAAAAVLALALVASLVGTWMLQRERPAPRRQVQFTVLPPPPYTLTAQDVPALSPDGDKLAFTATPPSGPSMLFVRALDSIEAKAIPGTAGAASPFWSPDGRRVGFFAGSKLKVAGLDGGAPVSLADGYCCGTWNRDGVILFTGHSPNFADRRTFRIRSEGGVAAEVRHLDLTRGERSHQWPVFLPDGRRFLYYTRSARADVQGVYAASLDSDDVTKVTASAGHAVFVPPGFVVFRLRGRLAAQAYDVRQSRLSGEPVQVAETFARANQWFYNEAAVFTAVPDAVAYIPGAAAPTTLTWLDRNGNRLGTVGEPGEYYNPQLSPDERMLAVGRTDLTTDTRDIWLLDLSRGGAASRLTFDPADDANPAWSPDGTRVFFSSARRGQRDIYEKAPGATAGDRLLFGSETDASVEYVSPDGKLLLFNTISTSGRQQIRALPLGRDGAGKPFTLLSGPADIQSAPISPDGRFVAHASTESGRVEVFVQALSSGLRWPISTGGGHRPQWRADGKELFYVSAGSKLMAVDIRTTGERLEAGIPHVLFEAPFWQAGRNTFVPSRDGRRFLAVLQAEQSASRAITVELNWMARLKLARVPR